MGNPEYYYENNVGGTLALLKVMRACRVKNIILSSAVKAYSEENELLQGQKCMIEQMLEAFAKAYDLNGIVLRYCKSASASGNSEAAVDGTGNRGNIIEVANAHVVALEALEREKSAFRMFDLSEISSK